MYLYVKNTYDNTVNSLLNAESDPLMISFCLSQCCRLSQYGNRHTTNGFAQTTVAVAVSAAHSTITLFSFSAMRAFNNLNSISYHTDVVATSLRAFDSNNDDEDDYDSYIYIYYVLHEYTHMYVYALGALRIFFASIFRVFV